MDRFVGLAERLESVHLTRLSPLTFFPDPTSALLDGATAGGNWAFLRS